MGYNEADTRSKLIDPAIRKRGWTEDLIKRVETAGAIEIVNGKPRRRAKGRTDYTLRVKVRPEVQPVAVALIEAKPEDRPPAHGLEQGKAYGAVKRLNVPFIFASNGHQFVEYDHFTGLTSAARRLEHFPTPDELRARYEAGKGFRLDDEAAKPLLVPYKGGETSRRYYQDAAIRAALEKVATGQKRALLSLATGAGKTFIAVNLLKRIADAGQMTRALFICDRDELREQGLGAFSNVFGTNAAPVTGDNPQKNARVLVATYQTLDVDSDEADANFLTKNYPENYFSHIVIDECHRSAWGKWSQVLSRNSGAVQFGLTATPRQIEVTEATKDAKDDEKINADNIRHFGEPVYEYELGQGIEDGYLAACEIIARDIFIDDKRECERKTGISQADLAGKVLTDPRTGLPRSELDARPQYDASAFEARLVLPDRVKRMAEDLFANLLENGGAHQKTIIFCASDRHADAVAIEMNNAYARWSREQGQEPFDFYAFKCTAESNGNDLLPDFRASKRSHFIATTVELLTTGVDVRPVRNIVFYRYLNSPIALHQMLGRGTRLDPDSDKLMFRVYDYTDATRLFGQPFITKLKAERETPDDGGDDDGAPDPVTIIEAEGFDVRVTPAGRTVLALVDGETVRLTVEEYKERVAAKLVEEAPTIDAFREQWLDPASRQELLGHLPASGQSAVLVRALAQMGDYDLYDVLAELGYGLAPRTRAERADAFASKHEEWLAAMPADAAATIKALAGQFAVGGIEGLETQHVWQTPDVMKAGGLAALRVVGKPADVLKEAKGRMFTA